MGLGLKNKLRSTLQSIRWKFDSVLQRLRPTLGLRGARVGASFHAPTDMGDTDRIFLHALVRGLRPERALEIGSRWGGSAQIITAAMEDNDCGKLVGLDPATDAFRAPKRKLYGRFTLIKGRSPEDVPMAAQALNGPIDLVFIDALHTKHSCSADIHAVLPFLAPGGHLLMHDAFHPGIRAAADELLASRPDAVDLGQLTRTPHAHGPVCGQGFRLIRMGDNRQTMIEDAYQRTGVPYPEHPGHLHNYDRFALRIGLVEEIDGVYQWKTQADGQDPS